MSKERDVLIRTTITAIALGAGLLYKVINKRLNSTGVTGSGHTTKLSYYEVLGVRRNASKQEIKAAYHNKVKMYHPDKVASMGPEFQELAEKKMREINEAYEQLK